jgi:eukaryotic-like serine/threonine-protein kinase
MGSKGFKDEFLSHYGIQTFFQAEKKGGQKSVHFVVIGGKKQVMKIFDGGKDQRFEREMKIYEKYKGSDGIPKVFEISEYEGETVVFEEYIEGETLEDVVDNYTGNDVKIKELVQRLFAILTPIWKDRYVHRDIKPANIIIRPDGSPVLLDFGIARDLGDTSITGTGGPQPGTWKWAAPEQYAGQKDMISYRTDFFSLGVVAYFLYHKQLPFGNRPDDIDVKFKSGDETCPIANGCAMKDFLVEAMRFKPSHRPKDIEDLIKLI